MMKRTILTSVLGFGLLCSALSLGYVDLHTEYNQNLNPSKNQFADHGKVRNSVNLLADHGKVRNSIKFLADHGKVRSSEMV